jgi:hypothetical protein
MTLGRKIDDVLRFNKAAIVEHKHLARNNFVPLASCLVCLEVRWPLTSKLEGNAFAHHTDRVHSIHDRVDTLFQQVALGDLNRHLVPISNTNLDA